MDRLTSVIDHPAYGQTIRNLSLLAGGYLLGMWSAIAYLN